MNTRRNQIENAKSSLDALLVVFQNSGKAFLVPVPASYLEKVKETLAENS